MAQPPGETAPPPFLHRHLGPSDADVSEMLKLLDVSSLDQLVERAVPSSIRSTEDLRLPPAGSEAEVTEELLGIAALNDTRVSMIGQGYHDTITPPVVLRNVVEDPGWYTAYTPYQPEISQGRLEALFNFQTMVADLTGFEVANASLLDEGTAAAEAMTMTRRISRSASDVFFVDSECHPQTVDVIRTRAEPLGIHVAVGDPFDDLGAVEPFGALLQYPGTTGVLRDLSPVVDAVHIAGGLAVVAADLLSLCLLEPPGEWGADIAVGSAQRFGVPMGFGGPHAGYLATRDEHRRSLPGRVVGLSVDSAGRPALRLALQTREQHIRREKATSNICTAQVLLANVAAFYAVWHGPEGLKAIAERVHRLAAVLAAGLRSAGVETLHESFFDTVAARVPGAPRRSSRLPSTSAST